jgi:N-acylmannosamine kinase
MIAALDIGGTKLAASLVDGARVIERREAPTPNDRGPLAVAGAAIDLLRPLLARASALGVAATGQVADGRVTALNIDTLQGWNAFDLQSHLAEGLGLTTVVLNDADAAAWGEFAHGAGRGTSDFAFITVSTGVGSGLVLGGRLHLTHHGLQAELGYTLSKGGQPLELVASGGALDRWARSRGWSGAREVVRRAAEGDTEANAALDEGAALIAEKLADMRVLLGLDRVAVGGGLGLAPGYLDRVRAELARLDSLYEMEVVPAALGTDAGLVGAADWAARQLAQG